MTDYFKVDGAPRYHHKTTRLIEWADDHGDQTLIVAAQHQQAEELCENHLGPGKYGIDADRVVWLQGKGRSCPSCPHDVDGEDWYKVERAAERALEQHRVVRPEVFSEVCPYAATKAAVKDADWVVTVSEMVGRVDENFDEWTVIVDEESTQMSFFPKSSRLFEFSKITSPMAPQGFAVTEDVVSQTNGLQSIIDKVQNKIDSLQRVPKRYVNILNAAHALQVWHATLTNSIDWESAETVIESIEDHEFPDVEVQGSEREVTATFEYLRTNFGRYNVESALEAMMSNPKIHVERSQDRWNVYLIPDPEADIVIYRDLFENANRVGVVGRSIATYFLDHLTDDFETEAYDQVRTTNLEIVVVEGDEQTRRGTMTKISRKLSDTGIHNLLIAGSGTRAAQAQEHIGPRSYFFRGQATLEEYAVPAQADWSVVSYMGSRLTRGVDVDTQVTIVRSSQFAAPRWNYYDTDEYDHLRSYENLIETHNAMLRGAGQGEQHVAVIPGLTSMYYGLLDYVTSFDVEELDEILSRVLEAIGVIVEGLLCEHCEKRFVDEAGYRDHECGGHSPR